MDAISITIGICFSATALICLAVSVPLIRGEVPRNGIYGVRLPESFASDDAWMAINKFGGKQMVAGAIPLLLIGMISFFLPLQANVGLSLALCFVPLACILIPLFVTWRYARRYAATHREVQAS